MLIIAKKSIGRTQKKKKIMACLTSTSMLQWQLNNRHLKTKRAFLDYFQWKLYAIGTVLFLIKGDDMKQFVASMFNAHF